jgi:hypothetical protein
MTPTRHEWKNGLEEMARENKVLLISLNEIVQIENDKLLPTQEWNEYLAAFCKMVEIDYRYCFKRKRRNMYLPNAAHVFFRYGNTEMIVAGDLLGPAFV